MKLTLLATALGLTLLTGCDRGSTEAPSTTKAPHREATADERYTCEMATTRGDFRGDCSKVPADGPIYEDDPWGRWDCATMGNRRCGPTN